jgi:hypothetical protein
MKEHTVIAVIVFAALFALAFLALNDGDAEAAPVETLNEKETGYRGVWYMNQPSGDKYVYKYSGGLGTYCAKHRPFAVYRKEVDKTFFCYGGARKGTKRRLVHMVSYFDHQTGAVPRPTLLLDKQTVDAHDNPVIQVDDEGYIWIFSTAHGTMRPSYIHRSKKPYDIDAFERIDATYKVDGKEVEMDNNSYVQYWYQPGRGFVCFFTKYHNPAVRTNMFMTSKDGIHWSEWTRLAAINKGHYQVSDCTDEVAGAAFNYHPDKGLNWRTNLYYMETRDGGRSWQAADGAPLKNLPLREVNNPALVHDYESEKLNVYMKDINYDKDGRPVILYVTSKGYEAGPDNDPRTWTTARWTGKEWEIRPVTASDNNYDMGPIYIEDDGAWRIVGPTETGPQDYNPGGEVAMWVSEDKGATWTRVKRMTTDSERNHTYVRRPVNAHPDFYGVWADGHGRKPSISNLYFCNKAGDVFLLPRTMKGRTAKPKKVE